MPADYPNKRRVTHGRHCSCSACAREDWTRITGPCGMHGSDCPRVYAPLADANPNKRLKADPDVTPPEDALVIAEVLRRVRDAVGRLGIRADGAIDQADLYHALNDDYERASHEAKQP